jgi:hypothetical protein
LHISWRSLTKPDRRTTDDGFGAKSATEPVISTA